ncbi:hypothetical protein CPB85DRAFT_24163 [Mucidula mucida]|nr:hypothetical protein CPB85DRAFT_24163 [Mucidula mucida]
MVGCTCLARSSWSIGSRLMIVINRKATTTGQLANSPGSNSQASAHPPSASKSQDSQTPAKGRRRSFFFGLFSSSAADKSAPHHVATGTKLTKVQSPPAPSKQPVIRSLSPDLLRDPAFSSDPQSHLFNVGQHGRRSPAYNGDAGLKPEQLQPLTSGQQRQIWRPLFLPHTLLPLHRSLLFQIIHLLPLPSACKPPLHRPHPRVFLRSKPILVRRSLSLCPKRITSCGC